MGCWNQTCGVTNLPITWSDKIVLIPLIQNHVINPELTYNVNDCYEPFGLPVYGEYNDYGGIKKASTHPKNIEFYNKNDFFNSPDFYEDEESDVIFTENDLDNFFSGYICYDGMYVKHRNSHKRINYMMVHKELYDKLIYEMGLIIPYGQIKTLRELHKEKIKRSISKIIEYKNEIAKSEEDWYVDMCLVDFKIKDAIEECCMIDLITPKTTYEFIFDSLMQNMDESLLDELVNMLLFKRALMHLRKGYLVMSGAGSQDDDLYFHKIVSEFVLEYINKKIYEYKKGYEDEEFNEKEFLTENIWWWDKEE